MSPYTPRNIGASLRFMKHHLVVWGERWCPSITATEATEGTIGELGADGTYAESPNSSLTDDLTSHNSSLPASPSIRNPVPLLPDVAQGQGQESVSSYYTPTMSDASDTASHYSLMSCGDRLYPGDGLPLATPFCRDDGSPSPRLRDCNPYHRVKPSPRRHSTVPLSRKRIKATYPPLLYDESDLLLANAGPWPDTSLTQSPRAPGYSLDSGPSAPSTQKSAHPAGIYGSCIGDPQSRPFQGFPYFDYSSSQPTDSLSSLSQDFGLVSGNQPYPDVQMNGVVGTSIPVIPNGYFSFS